MKTAEHGTRLEQRIVWTRFQRSRDTTNNSVCFYECNTAVLFVCALEVGRYPEVDQGALLLLVVPPARATLPLHPS